MELKDLRKFRFTTRPAEKGAPDALDVAKRLLSWSVRLKMALDALEKQERNQKDKAQTDALRKRMQPDLESFVADLERGNATGALYLIGDPEKIAKLELLATRAGRALEKLSAE